MGFFNGMRKGFFSGIQPKKWLDTKEISNKGHLVKDAFKNLGTTYKDANEDTYAKQASFEESMAHFKLSEKELAGRVTRYRKLSLVYISLAAAAFLYALILGFSGHISATVQAGALTLLFFAFFMKENVTYMRLKKRNLTLKLNDWVVFLLKGAK